MINRYKFIDTIKSIQEEMGDKIIVKDGGCTTYTNNGELSKGCQACKNGGWLPIFLGLTCNARCYFCNQNFVHKNDRIIPNVLGHGLPIDDVKYGLDIYHDAVKSIGYSGGEPMLYIDHLESISLHIKKNYPQIYLYMYSNNIAGDEEMYKRIADCGIQEIRFNLLATNFDQKIIDKIPLAMKYIPIVNLEMPSGPEVYHHLIEKGLIRMLDDMGIKQLNLIEYVINNERGLTKFNEEDLYSFVHPFLDELISPITSRLATYEIMKYVINNNIKMLVHDCSNESTLLTTCRIEENYKIKALKSM